MRLGSLRLRLVAGGIVAILVALTIAGAALILLFERHVTRTIADDLDVHLKQLLAGVDIDQAGNLVVTRPPANSGPIAVTVRPNRCEKGRTARQ